MAKYLLPAPTQYVHNFDRGVNVIDEAVRVHKILDALIPDREGLRRGYCSDSRVTYHDPAKYRGLTPKQQFLKMVRSELGLDDGLLFTNDWVGNISTVQEHEVSFPKFPGKNYMVKVKYDTREKGKITIETTELKIEDIQRLLAA